MDRNSTVYQKTRALLAEWEISLCKNVYIESSDYQHSIAYFFPEKFAALNRELSEFGARIASELEPLVNENNLAINLPRLESYNTVGEPIDQVVHHPSYIAAGDIIYGSKLLEKMAKPGGLSACLALFFLSSHAGEAGHNCPIACSAGIIRVLKKLNDFPNQSFYIEKLISPSYVANFTGAQFLTEIQGGSDVGLNATRAEKEGALWRIYGEKWFCSNAGADLIFITARFDSKSHGTKGLGLFLVPAEWDGKKNAYVIRRLKDKIGTRSMATGEIDFLGACAIPVGPLEEGFHLVMDNVLHLSRLFNTFCVLGMAKRAYMIAHSYARYRVAFDHPIIDYPLIKENLAKIKAENTALLSGAFVAARMQDDMDLSTDVAPEKKLLIRLLVNLMKYFSAFLSVQHVHHALDILAGNGTIENFSSIPRLLRDCIVCENWEGTHNVLRMQILRDMLRYNVDQLYIEYIQDKCNKINSPDKKNIEIYLLDIAEKLKLFHELPSELQLLEIEKIVERMVIVYCAVMLLEEALHQEKEMRVTTKLDCYNYFCMLHLNNQPMQKNKNYLSLITKMVG